HPPGKRGPKPTKGKRQRSLQGWAERSDTPWETVEVVWYGGQLKTLWVFSRTALWYTPRQPPVAIRYVLVADPEGKLRMEAFFCTDLEATPVEILQWVVMRWSVEVTFEESRTHLGLETQRQWSDQAIARTTPVLLALFSIVALWADKLYKQQVLNMEQTAWYHKQHITFSDAIAAVRSSIYKQANNDTGTPNGDMVLIPKQLWEQLTTLITRAA